MLTGDRPEVAMEVARKARISPNSDYCLTGKQMVGMALSDVARQAAYVSIFARLLPSQKGVLVRLFQQTYHCVAMVGDGANDTLALKAAQVAISFMKNSSPMARRVSDILISDLSDLLTVIARSNGDPVAGRAVTALQRPDCNVHFACLVCVEPAFTAFHAVQHGGRRGALT